MCLLLKKLGEAKMAVYISRRNKMEGKEGHNAHTVFLCNTRARVVLEFQFYKTIGDVDAFKQRWCYGGFICSVENVFPLPRKTMKTMF